jgi:hypothetical protein
VPPTHRIAGVLPCRTPEIPAPHIADQPAGYSVGPGGGITQSPTLQANLSGLQSTFGQEAGAYQQLGATVQPGYSQLRRAGLNQINTTAKANLSTLQGNLAQRRIQGSSFANAQISQANADTEQQKANFTAQSYLDELNASATLIQQQYGAATQQFSTAINQSNIESSTAASLVSNINSTMAQTATVQAQLDAQNAAGIGKLAGKVLGLGTGGGTTVGGSLFSGAGSGLNSLFGSSPSYVGGNIFSGDAYGGNAANPLEGLTADDYA